MDHTRLHLTNQLSCPEINTGFRDPDKGSILHAPLFFVERILVLQKHCVWFPHNIIFIILPILIVDLKVFVILFHHRSDALSAIYLFNLTGVIIEVLLEMAWAPSDKVNVRHGVRLISNEVLNFFAGQRAWRPRVSTSNWRVPILVSAHGV